MIAETLTALTTADALERLHRHGVPAAPIQRVDQVLDDPQVRHRAMITEMEHPAHGPVPTLGTPLKIDGTMELAVEPPARLGQHTDAVLRDVAGYDAARIEKLRAAGVVR